MFVILDIFHDSDFNSSATVELARVLTYRFSFVFHSLEVCIFHIYQLEAHIYGFALAEQPLRYDIWAVVLIVSTSEKFRPPYSGRDNVLHNRLHLFL